MRPQYQRIIEEKIRSDEFGTVYTATDFMDIAPASAINEAMHRMMQNGLLHRVMNGVYYKPKYSDLLGEYVMPQMESVAEAIARKFNWTIAPAGDTALNMLHLSTQVPAYWTFVSDGPYRKYMIGHTTLEFKSVKTRDIAGKHKITIMVIQALKTLGKDHVTKEVIDRLKGELSDEDKKLILDEGQTTSKWIFEYLRDICKG